MLAVRRLRCGEGGRVTASLVEALHAWHDFYIVLATAAATLIGTMFVVVSIGIGFLTPERAREGGVFLTPTVVHLGVILASTLVAIAPFPEDRILWLAYGALALGGLAYAAFVGAHVSRRRLERGDRLWYGLAPIAGYLALLAAALLAARGMASCLWLLAAALAFLLLAAIRNAWDIVIFFVVQPRGPG